jgi:predicted Zn-dependent protease
MERSFRARYFTAGSDVPVTVHVSFRENDLHITWYDENNAYRQRNWGRAEMQEVQRRSSIIELRFGQHLLYEQLEITDADFIAQYMQKFHRSRTLRWRPASPLASVLLVMAGILLLLWAAYVWLLPVISDAAARSFPKSYEISAGKQMYHSVLAGEQVDTLRTHAINRFFAQMEVEGDYPVEIAVIEGEVTNAFAMPGGGIVVYDQMLKKTGTAEELAALLAHEYSHVQLKHATRNIFRNIAGHLFLSMVLSDVDAIAGVLIRNAENIRTLSYSRALEQEADLNGLVILRKNKIDAAGMKRLFETLRNEVQVEQVEMLSSHPDLNARIQAVGTFTDENPYLPVLSDSMQVYFRMMKEPQW